MVFKRQRTNGRSFCEEGEETSWQIRLHVDYEKSNSGRRKSDFVELLSFQADQGVFKVLATNPHGKHSVEQNYVANCVANEVFKTQ
ncbi:hypothetical protein M3Y98_00558000 [Aphelenchoides besseyi]|nr:hypothetical protein M3Y98_00558000 [Aphelenchoides besseyi]